MYQTTKLVKLLLATYLKNQTNLTCIDATCGNGHDTLFLLETLDETSHVHAYDIQLSAINETSKRVSTYSNVTLHHTSFENIDFTFDICLFNLGYLPGGDKSITTMAHTTVKTLQKLMSFHNQSFLILISCYPGHPEGKREADAVKAFCQELDHRFYLVTIYQNINQSNAPFLITITNHFSKAN